jgi:cellulose 1,4-beta-cellobiosidase
MNTTTSAAPYALSLTITGAAGSITHTASTTLLVNLAAPTSLTATSGSAGQITLSWAGSVAATSYHVKRALVSGGPYTSVACTTTTNYNDTGLTNGTTYYYVVSAAYNASPDAGGESADSSEDSATPSGSPPSAPVAPTNVTASPGNPHGSVSLHWTQSATPGVTQNYIYRRTSTGSYPSIPTVKIAAATTYLNTKLTSGANYCYVVTAVSSGGESARSQPEACARAK